VFIVGIDENGLGPILGPLVTTAVTFELSRYRADKQAELGRSLGIDDSKNTASFGQMKAAEGLALAVCERLQGELPAHADQLLDALLLDRPTRLRKGCPENAEAQCWSVALPVPCFGGDAAKGREMLAALKQRGLMLAHTRSAVACTGDLNRRLRRGQSRVEVDLELMERLVLDARGVVSAELRAICGMVGGIRNYDEKWRHFAAHAVTKARTRDGSLAYEVEGVGHVRFEIDADARHLPVALASMVGKYVRELWMERQNRFYRSHDPALEEVSGYHDPVTRRFITASALLRKRIGIENDCFERKNQKQIAALVPSPLEEG
jgi:ribonuclease HII